MHALLKLCMSYTHGCTLHIEFVLLNIFSTVDTGFYASELIGSIVEAWVPKCEIVHIWERFRTMSTNFRTYVLNVYGVI